MQHGFCIIHANHLESLATLAIEHCRNEPLAPLEEEILLVQSNGMADWLKLQQAQATGISAAMRCPMPASFLWEMYQRVLDPAQLHNRSPFEKDSLQWRLLRILPTLLDQPGFERPKQFLQDDDNLTKLFQLARRQADLFDQYQLYRADWVRTWEAGDTIGLGRDEQWQAALWRALVASMPEHERGRSRAHLHRAFMDRLNGDDTPEGLPRRLFLFGINSLPQQLLEALYALSRHCQILLMVLSPCEQYWGDRGIGDLEGFESANALLDSWGAQGRDFLKLMTAYEPTEIELAHTQEINPYAPAAEHTRSDSIICQLQQAMLDNRQPDAAQQLPVDPGLAFYPAYSRQREVEVLHDKLLSLFAADESLQYSDVVVMTPDIDRYAPHVEAVFNRYAKSDARRLAFSISDRHDNDTPLYNAVDYLLGLPSQRLTFSEVFSLLQLPAIRTRAGIAEDDLEALYNWIEATCIRWGWDDEHKKQILELPAEASGGDWRHNTWRAGLDQLLAGYCAGDTDIFTSVAVDEVSANHGVLLGRFDAFVATLDRFRQRLGASCTPAGWVSVFSELLDALFTATGDEDRLLLDGLIRALSAWQEDCDLAGLTDELPLAQARQGWLDRLEQAGMGQQLSFTGITFCTLMPMRALPFKHVFLLGMNDGDYPREQQPVDFDLMAKDYRPGDRNRRDDDQYLFLEALMSVRDSLHISWVGFDINKNTERPACTLVAQLREQVDRYWHTSDADADGKEVKASEVLTQASPLASFSRRYFEQHAASAGNSWAGKQWPDTWAAEWRRLHSPIEDHRVQATDDAAFAEEELQLGALVRLLKSPDEVFYRQRLGVMPIEPEETLDDDEPFELNGLQRWHLRNDLLASLLDDEEPALIDWQKSGALPPGGFGQPALRKESSDARSIHRRWEHRLGEADPLRPEPLQVALEAAGTRCLLVGNLTHAWQLDDQLILAQTTASNLRNKNGWRFDKIAPAWVAHLAACADGLKAASFVVSRDAQLGFSPVSAEQARQRLNRLFLLYLEAWHAPLHFNPDGVKLPNEAEEPPPAEETVPQAAIRDHWPESEDDEEGVRFMAELLYRPIQDAIAENNNE